MRLNHEGKRLIAAGLAIFALCCLIAFGQLSRKAPVDNTLPDWVERPRPWQKQPVDLTATPIVVDAQKTATVMGKITFEGPVPPPRDLAKEMTRDTDTCLQGRTQHHVWHVGPDRGLANVVVWLRAGQDKYFQIPEEVAAKAQQVEIDIPHCMYEPSIVVLFPNRFDVTKQEQVRTGQSFSVKDSAKIAHLTVWKGKFNSADGRTIQRVQKIEVWSGPHRSAGGEDLIQITCAIHPWMMAHAWAFDHPFAAVSSGGRPGQTEFGAYKIEGVPVGVELELVYWHESMRSRPPVVLRKITLGPGMNRVDFTLKAD